jgi:hypothetical protein
MQYNSHSKTCVELLEEKDVMWLNNSTLKVIPMLLNKLCCEGISQLSLWARIPVEIHQGNGFCPCVSLNVSFGLPWWVVVPSPDVCTTSMVEGGCPMLFCQSKRTAHKPSVSSMTWDVSGHRTWELYRSQWRICQYHIFITLLHCFVPT